MTDIDLDRLAVDRGYWDSVAPEGATHYCRARKDWLNYYAVSVDYCCIPRPIKQDREGEDSAKHVGMKFQTSLGKCELMAIDSNKVTCCVKMDDSGHLSFCSLDALMPIRTHAERQREELISVIDRNRGLTSQVTADAILSRYNLEKK